MLICIKLTEIHFSLIYVTFYFYNVRFGKIQICIAIIISGKMQVRNV